MVINRVVGISSNTREFNLKYTARKANYSCCKAPFVVLFKRDKSSIIELVLYETFLTLRLLVPSKICSVTGIIGKKTRPPPNNNFMISAFITYPSLKSPSRVRASENISMCK